MGPTCCANDVEFGKGAVPIHTLGGAAATIDANLRHIQHVRRPRCQFVSRQPHARVWEGNQDQDGIVWNGRDASGEVAGRSAFR